MKKLTLAEAVEPRSMPFCLDIAGTVDIRRKQPPPAYCRNDLVTKMDPIGLRLRLEPSVRVLRNKCHTLQRRSHHTIAAVMRQGGEQGGDARVGLVGDTLECYLHIGLLGRPAAVVLNRLQQTESMQLRRVRHAE